MKKKNTAFRIARKILYTFYPKYHIIGEPIPDEPVILVGNHCQMYGPLACEFFFSEDKYSWCAGQMMNLKEVPAYAFQDFWSQKPKRTHFFYKMISYLIAPLSVFVFKNARTVPVYRDLRIMTTFKESIRLLKDGKSLVIFPEHNQTYNQIIYDFQRKFIDVASIYYKKSGKEISFVPFYIAPRLKKMVIGKPTAFVAEKPLEEERERIRQYLMDEITAMGENLPIHTVIPYRNIKKKDYPKNRR